MNKPIFIVITVLIIAAIGGNFVFQKLAFSSEEKQVTRETVMSTIQRLQQLISEKEKQGVNVSGARELDRQSQHAFKRGDIGECLRLLNEAVNLLESGSTPIVEPIRTKIERYYFYEVHMEPGNENSEMFNELEKFVNLADKYKIKLTLLFTPQWAEMILADSKKLSKLNQWKSQGHEIGGHHHGPNIWTWDGYSNLSIKEIDEIRASRPRIPKEKVQDILSQEKYRGNMKDFVNLLNKLVGGKIKVITMSNEHQDWPDGIPYAAGGNFIKEAVSIPRKVNFSSHDVIKVTSASFLARHSIRTGLQITVEQLKDRFLSSEQGIFGVVSHEMDYKENPHIYEEWFKFLNSQDPLGKHSKTISEIIETNQQR